MKTFAMAVALTALVATPVFAAQRTTAQQTTSTIRSQTPSNPWCQGRHHPRNPYSCNYMPGSE